jgi:hypothetical protein
VGATSTLYYCLNYEDQHWQFQSLGNGWGQIVNNNSRQCLTVPSWANYHAVQYTCAAYLDQQWQWSTNNTPDSEDFYFMNRNTGTCLVAPSWAPGQILLYTCGYADQIWWLPSNAQFPE